MAWDTRKRGRRFLYLAAIAIVAISRMYLGVHTPADVFVSLGISTGIVLLMAPLFRDEASYHRSLPALLLGLLAFTVGSIVFVGVKIAHAGPAPDDNLLSGRTNAYKMLGSLIGFLFAYELDQRTLRFDVRSNPLGQVVKVTVGFGLVLALRSGLKVLFALLGTSPVFGALRYFIVVLTGGYLWPLTFRFITEKTQNVLDRWHAARK